MNEHLEIEYKILLTKDVFETILKDYQNKITKDYIQTNHYFIHPLLEKKKYMLRIREKDNQLEMTLKRPINHYRLETNIMISEKDMDKIIHQQPLSNEIIDILKKEHINPLELINEFSLTTHRYDIQLDEGILSLDHSTYLNQEDYELEFEVYNEKEGFYCFLELIKPYSLSYSQNCLSKIQRVLKAKANMIS